MDSQGDYRFAGFTLDLRERQLRRGGAQVDLSSRYFDALALLVRERGSLVSKDRFLDEVWQGVPVTDEALSQCVKTLRRQLGDDAARPRFIETVPKHGYRFIAPLEEASEQRAAVPVSGTGGAGLELGRLALLVGAGTIGGGMAGIAGGLLYGLGGAYQPLEAGMGAASVLLVLLSIGILAGLIGGFGISLGMAAASLWTRSGAWLALGGALSGAAVGGAARLFGLDTFNLLFGYAPGGITGGLEGLVMGALVGLGAWLGGAFGTGSLGRASLVGGVAGAAAGLLVPLLGGRLLGGSLELLSRSFAGSRLRLDPLGRLFGEDHFGQTAQMAFGMLEGFLFGACVAGAIALARRQMDESPLFARGRL